MRAATLILTLMAGTAHAQFMDGNDLYERMNSTGVKLVSAQGYVMGVADAELGTLWCPPPNVTLRQVFDITKQFLEAVPEKRHESGSAYVIAAVRTTWPCKPKAKGTTL